MTTNVLNPKMGAFYVAVSPQFIAVDSSVALVGVLLALVHDIEGMCWFTVLICCAHAARQWLNRRSVQRAEDTTTGTFLIGFDINVASSSPDR